MDPDCVATLTKLSRPAVERVRTASDDPAEKWHGGCLKRVSKEATPRMLPTVEAPFDSLLLRPDAEQSRVSPEGDKSTPWLERRSPTPAAAADAPADASALLGTPTTIAETGLAADNVEALVLKVLYAGEMSGRALSDQIKINYGILEPIIAQARLEQLIEVKRATGVGTAGYEYALTDRGRDRTRQFFEVNGMSGRRPSRWINTSAMCASSGGRTRSSTAR